MTIKFSLETDRQTDKEVEGGGVYVKRITTSLKIKMLINRC